MKESSLFNQYSSIITKLFQAKDYEFRESSNRPVDFIFSKGKDLLLIETKIHITKKPSSSEILQGCQILKDYSKENNQNSVGMILIVSDVLEDSFKKNIKKETEIDIWDINTFRREIEKIGSTELLNEYDKFEANILVSQFFNEQKSGKNVSFNDSNKKKSVFVAKKNEFESRLNSIQSGKEKFAEFENWCKEVFEYLFGNNLAELRDQNVTDDGLFRYDLVSRINPMDNAFWQMIIGDFHSRYLVIECKNYSDEISQKEIFTTEKYLYKTALRNVCFLVGRNGYDKHSETAVKGILRESGKLIVLLSSNDLLDMIEKVDNGEAATDYMFQKLDNFLIEIGK